jgi:hypothetical protein
MSGKCEIVRGKGVVNRNTFTFVKTSAKFVLPMRIPLIRQKLVITGSKGFDGCSPFVSSEEYGSQEADASKKPAENGAKARPSPTGRSASHSLPDNGRRIWEANPVGRTDYTKLRLSD